MYIFGVWEEAGGPRTNPHRHGENLHTPPEDSRPAKKCWVLKQCRSESQVSPNDNAE